MNYVRPNIYDLARVAGISTGTISRAFNHSPNNRISAETREMILQKAREIGYSPHSGARAITSGRTRRWGLLLPHLYNPRYAELVDHLDLEAHQRSTLLQLGLARYNPSVEAELVTHWASGEADGIIADACVDRAVFDQLRRRRYPIVFLYGRPSPQFNFVDVRSINSFATLTKRLAALGHRRIGFVGPHFPEARFHDSFKGYARGLRASRLPLDEDYLHFGSQDYAAGAEAWQLWGKSRSRPTAVVCFNDIVACNFIQSIENAGYSVPGDFSVVGADDIPAAAHYKLTTIRSDPSKIAQHAFHLLEGKFSDVGKVAVVHASIVERSSLGPAPKAARRAS